MLKSLAKRVLLGAHRATLTAGLVVLPKHYYVPIADIVRLARDVRWAKRSNMRGIDFSGQAQRLKATVKPFEAEYRGNTVFRDATNRHFGPGFGYIEAQCLHGVLRSLKPKRIIEVGSGVSTHCALAALKRNGFGDITCIEPFPSSYIKGANVHLVESQVQDLDPSVFDELENGDFLFIDSTHAVKPAGDVVYLYSEGLPRLKPGVLVHIHDIFFPYLYQRDLLQTFYQWSESAILAALLTNNSKLRMHFSLSMLHYDEPNVLSDVFPEYNRAEDESGLSGQAVGSKHFPSSTYLQTA